MNIALILGGLILVVAAGMITFLHLTKWRHSEPAAEGDWLAANLKAEKSKSAIILNAIEDGVIVIDSQKNIQLFNPAAARLTGWPQEEALNLDIVSVLKLVDQKNIPYDDD